jgi:hypothetical protein
LTSSDRTRNTDYIPNKKLPQVVPFTWQDFSLDYFHPDNKVSVTWKTDGEHAFLISHKYLNQNMLFLYTMGSQKLIKIANLDSVMGGLILEGEYVEKDEGVKEFFVFDCLDARPVQDMANQITEQEHTDRLIFADKLVQRLKDFKVSIDIYMKTFYSLYPVDVEKVEKFDQDHLRTHIFSRMKEVFSKEPKSYINDGLIFTPGSKKYTELIDKRSIRKWKPVEKLTIDLLVDYNSKTLLDNSGRIIELDTDFEKLKDNDNQVVEFNFIDGKLNKVKLRDDKTQGNGPRVVDQNLALIRDPITQDVMQGESMRIYRKYHNQIKRNLFNTYKGDSLFDIGSGKGGDLGKMKKFKTINLLEPNKEYLEELNRRMKSHDLTDVKIMNLKAEDTKAVEDYFDGELDYQVDVISSMLSLSFFYLDEEKLDGLVNTIDFMAKDSCYFIFLTIDKDYLLEVMNGKTSITQNGLLAELFVEEGKAEYKERLKISLLDSKTLGGQVEGLVDLQKLKDKLNEKGWTINVVEDERADKQPIMSGFEYLFSQAYRYGCWMLSKIGDKIVESDDVMTPFLFEDGIKLSCITDRYSLLHAVLKAVMLEYQENSSTLYRDNAVKSLEKTLIGFSGKQFDFDWKEITLGDDWPLIAQVLFKFFNIFIFVINVEGKIIFRPKAASDFNVILIKNKNSYSLLVQEMIEFKQTIFNRNHKFVEYFYEE